MAGSRTPRTPAERQSPASRSPRNAALTLLDPSGATAALGAGAHPLDEAVSADGSLSPLGEVGTLPAGAVGLASS
jgi:hypothetical protein